MPSPLLNVMIKAAKKASTRLRRDFNELENLQVSTKGPANFVSSADIRTQEIIFNELFKAKPDWSFTMEEKATEIMNLLNTFRLQWGRYVEVMDKMGRRLDDAKKEYDSLVSTRKNQLEKPLTKIEEITSGGEVVEVVE